MTDDRPFWQAKPLSAMTEAEWESLCDGCGKCCLVKLEDIATGAIRFTDVTCRLLDAGTCRCGDYPNRQSHVPDCVRLSPDSLAELTWMPDTCAYRLLYEGEDLAWWHPLVSGDPETVHLAGMSVRGRIVSETEVRERDLPRHIVEWATN
jgi:hypothetical protein